MKRYGLLSLKIFLWIIGSLIFLILLVYFLIQVPAIQSFARKKAVTFLEGKIGTRVEINKISIDLPKLIVLEDVYFEDQKKDTLLAGDTLKVDISMLKLFSNTLEINEIDLRGITANIQRSADSTFNFDYIIKAFVTEQKTPPKPADSASALKFSLDKINLDRIKTTFKDAITATDADVYLTHFDTRVKEFDLDKMKFNIPGMILSGVNAKIIQGKPAVKSESAVKDSVDATEPFNLNLTLGPIALDRINLTYQNDVSAIKANVSLGKVNLEPERIDMKNQRVDLKTIDLANSNIAFALGKAEQAKVVAKEVTQEVQAQANNWRISANTINLNNNNIRFDNNNMPLQKQGMDFGHMNIKDLNFAMHDFVYAIDTISGKVTKGSFLEKSGFNLKRLETDFFYGKTQANLNNLYLQTSRTVIKDRIRLNYTSIESLTKNPGELRIDANIAGSRLGFKDVLVFVPTLASTEPFKGNPNATLHITGKINGQLKQLDIPNLEISGFRNTSIKASARITGLPDINKAYFNLNIADFSSRSADIASFVPKGTIPANIRLPEAIKLRGTFKGGMTSFSTNLSLNSSYGSAKAIASYNAVRKGNESYKTNVSLYNFNVGRLIKQEKTIGRITLAANISGTGTDPKTLSANLDGKVISAYYNGYTYHNLNLRGNSRRGIMTTTANMADPNLDFDLHARANLTKKYPQVSFTLNLDSANLQRLNFMKDDMRFRGKLVADLETADPDYLNGNIMLTNSIIARGGQRFQLDTVSVVSTANADSNTLHFRSEILTADITGKYKLTQAGQAMQELIGRYFSTGPKPKGAPATYSPQIIAFNARVINGPILTQFVPDMKELATVNLTGRFNSQAGELVVNGSAPRITYGTNHINNLQFAINTGNNALNYSFTLGLLSSPQLQIHNTSITGNAQNNVLTTNVLILDRNRKEHYRIAGALRSLEKDFEFRLRPDGLMLNYDLWSVSANNTIRFGSSGVQATDFSISNNNQRLSVNTVPPGLNNPLKIDFSNFNIETLTRIVQKDSVLAGGTINGTAMVSNLQASPVFTADMLVNNFSFRGDTVGNIALKVNNEKADTFAANVSITGKGNQVDLNGYYYTNNSSFDLVLNVANLNLKSIEGFTMGSMSQATGSIKGQLNITGTADAPKVRGGIDFSQAAFNVTMLNSYFKVKDSRIDFNEEGIRFNDFTLIDSAGNTASVNGTVYTQTFTDFRFGLDLRTNDFRVLNSTAKDSELYYGQLYLNSNLRIAGTMNAPSVDGSLKINEKTKLSVLLPQNDPAIEDREGIVEFIDMDNQQFASALTSQIDSLSKSTITGMNVSVNIEVDKEAEFNLIIDQGNGDFVRMRGEAQLNGGIDPSGKVSLTGTYQVEEGAYELSFNFLRRRFDIKKGSLITWTGEPTTADLDVTAVYIANTAPLDLVDNQLGDASQAQRNTYKQKLPFEVNLTMKGELLKPNITFDIVLPERNYNVSTEVTSVVGDRLTQLRQEPSELNKQVFALLLLNRFVGENPFASSAGGGGAESLARQSVSKLLSEQLNNLAGNLVAGVELNFDLESTEDYTTGQMKNRTDLNVGLSKRLLNDRLKVNIGSNFELEGPRQAGAKTSNFAGDISVDYQLSKDGRYMLRAYQRNEYQVALQGQVIETGVSFILTMDYNKFREIFAKLPEDEKQRRRSARAAKKQARKND